MCLHLRTHIAVLSVAVYVSCVARGLPSAVSSAMRRAALARSALVRFVHERCGLGAGAAGVPAVAPAAGDAPQRPDLGGERAPLSISALSGLVISRRRLTLSSTDSHLLKRRRTCTFRARRGGRERTPDTCQFSFAAPSIGGELRIAFNPASVSEFRAGGTELLPILARSGRFLRTVAEFLRPIAPGNYLQAQLASNVPCGGDPSGKY